MLSLDFVFCFAAHASTQSTKTSDRPESNVGWVFLPFVVLIISDYALKNYQARIDVFVSKQVKQWKTIEIAQAILKINELFEMVAKGQENYYY